MKNNFFNQDFYKSYKILQKSKKLNSTQKDIIELILSWQSENKQCFQSNNSICEDLGLSQKTLKNNINLLNKLDFFESKKVTTQNIYGSWVNSKIMVIDIDKLMGFLTEDNKILSTENETIQSEEIKPVVDINENKDINLPVDNNPSTIDLELKYVTNDSILTIITKYYNKTNNENIKSKIRSEHNKFIQTQPKDLLESEFEFKLQSYLPEEEILEMETI